MTAAPTLRFRVRKASKYLFDCAGVDPGDAAELQRLALVSVRAEELAALGVEDVDVRKRIGLEEVDRMIACCRQHPPEVVVAPAATKHRKQFEEFARYLADRKRAGVAPLAGGLLLMLAPLPGTHRFLRCVAVKAATTATGDGVVAVSALSLPKKRPLAASAVDEDKPPAPASASSRSNAVAAPSPAKSSRKRPRLDRSTSPDGRAAASTAAPVEAVKATRPPATEPKSKKEAKARPETNSQRAQGAVDLAVTCPNIATIDALGWRSRKKLVAQLRQESETFYSFRHEGLRRWLEQATPPS